MKESKKALPAVGLPVEADTSADVSGRVPINIKQHSPGIFQSTPRALETAPPLRRKPAFEELPAKDLAESKQAIANTEDNGRVQYPGQGRLGKGRTSDPVVRQHGAGREMRKHLTALTDARSSTSAKDAAVQRQSALVSLVAPSAGTTQARI